METTGAPPVTSAPAVAADPAAVLLAELDETLADAVRRASTRAEHLRLVRIQALVYALYGAPGAPAA